jgi:hypothetical protein
MKNISSSTIFFLCSFVWLPHPPNRYPSRSVIPAGASHRLDRSHLFQSLFLFRITCRICCTVCRRSMLSFSSLIGCLQQVGLISSWTISGRNNPTSAQIILLLCVKRIMPGETMASRTTVLAHWASYLHYCSICTFFFAGPAATLFPSLPPDDVSRADEVTITHAPTPS